jgi:hypothetical protein
MVRKISEMYNIILVVVIVVALGLLFFQNVSAITGHATSDSTTSNVTIEYYLSLALCSNLSEGISFGNVSSLPATNINATHNYDGVLFTGSTYCINVSDDGNTPIDLCLGANADLTNPALDVIEIGNETYANWTSTNATIPYPENETALSTNYAKSGLAIAAGDVNYYRFWLDIPAAQPSGSYNNSVYFKGVTQSVSCGSNDW